MTEEHKKLIEDNINLVYAAMRKYKLAEDEDWFGKIALDLCQNIHKFDPNKGRFSTFVFLTAYHTVCREKEKEKNQKKAMPSEIFSLDETVGFDTDALSRESSFHDIIADTYDNEEKYIKIIALQKACDKLSLRRRKILKYIYQGLTLEEIANKFGVTRQCISYHLCALRQEIIKELDNISCP